MPFLTFWHLKFIVCLENVVKNLAILLVCVKKKTKIKKERVRNRSRDRDSDRDGGKMKERAGTYIWPIIYLNGYRAAPFCAIYLVIYL